MFRQVNLLCAGLLAVAVLLPGVKTYSGEDAGTASKPELVEIRTAAGGSFPAAFFAGGTDKAAVFVPGAVFDKESWFDVNRRLQQSSIASLSLDGKTGGAVWGAVDFLKARGFKHILLVGGSMGGTAVLKALESRSDESITGVVLLAPAGGAPVKSPDIRKLFIVAKQDRLGLYAAVNALYRDSSEPKKFKEFDGSEHAQHLFKSAHKEALTALIVDFVSAENR